MSEEVEVKKTVKAKEPKFKLENLLKSNKYRYHKDALRVVLEAEKEYTINEVDAKIDSFMKGGK